MDSKERKLHTERQTNRRRLNRYTNTQIVFSKWQANEKLDERQKTQTKVGHTKVEEGKRDRQKDRGQEQRDGHDGVEGVSLERALGDLLQGHIYNFSRNYRSRIHFLKISQIFRHQKTGQRFGSTKFGRFRTRDYLCRRHERPMLVGVTRRRCVRRSFLLRSGASLYRSDRRSNPPLASHYGNKGGGM